MGGDWRQDSHIDYFVGAYPGSRCLHPAISVKRESKASWITVEAKSWGISNDVYFLPGIEGVGELAGRHSSVDDAKCKKGRSRTSDVQGIQASGVNQGSGKNKV